MKRLVSCIVFIILVAVAVLPTIFCVSKNLNSASAEELDGTFDIIGINDTVVEQNNNRTTYTPASSTGELMGGYSITPTYDEFNQIAGSTYGVNLFQIGRGQSIFMWIYIPDDPLENFFTLTISFLGQDSSSLTWSLAPLALRELINNSTTINRGWKLFEFSLNDATLIDAYGNEISSTSDITFSTLKISYKLESEVDSSVSLTKSAGQLTIYHVYLDGEQNAATSVIQSQNYAFYKISDKFSTSNFGLYVGDSFVIEDIFDLFDYIYVGKDNLLEFSYSKYSWSLELYVDGDTNTLDFGKSLKISAEGWCNLIISLSETRLEKAEEVLAFSRNFYVSNFNFCHIPKDYYIVEIGGSVAVVVTLSNDFELAGDISVAVGNEKYATAVLEESDAGYSIVVTGVKAGSTTLTFSAVGARSGESSAQSYSTQVTIIVNSSGSVSLSIIFMWVILSIYLVGFVAFLVISLVNARKNDVK